MTRRTTLATGIGLLLLPVLVAVLPHRHPVPGQASERLVGASLPPPAPAHAAVASGPQPRPVPPRAVFPVVASVAQGVLVCAGLSHEDELGQPIVAPVAAVILVDAGLSDLWYPPPLVACHDL